MEHPTLTMVPCRLFFRAMEPAAGLSQLNRAYQVPSNVLSELSSANVALPYTFEMAAASSLPKVTVSIRLLQTKDLSQIGGMCVAEYGSNITSLDALLKKPSESSLVDYIDSLSLRALVDFTMRMKIHNNGDNDGDSDKSIPADHAILVASCLESGDIVGMVEVSRQPPLANRNPSPFPIPMVFKELFCRAVGVEKLQGWVANLLVQPQYRGKGYSKVLMATVEGVVRRWDCQSIHLHADADNVSGMVPQRLYQTLGYEFGTDDKQQPDLAWMGPATLSSSVYVIDGVPLLYLQKQLKR